MKCGEILLATYPFTDNSTTKVRPVLVVSADVYNTGEDRVVVPLSSAPPPDDPHSFYIDASSPHFQATGLSMGSAVKWTKPMTISRRVIHRRLGCLHPSLLAEVRTKIITIFGYASTP